MDEIDGATDVRLQLQQVSAMLAASPARQRLTDAQAEALYAQGYLHQCAGKWPLARDHFQMLAIYRPDEPRYLRALGIAFRKTGRLEEALPVQRLAMSLSPADPVLSMDLAETLIANHQFAAARAVLDLTRAQCRGQPAHARQMAQAEGLQSLLQAAEVSDAA